MVSFEYPERSRILPVWCGAVGHSDHTPTTAKLGDRRALARAVLLAPAIFPAGTGGRVPGQ